MEKGSWHTLHVYAFLFKGGCMLGVMPVVAAAAAAASAAAFFLFRHAVVLLTVTLGATGWEAFEVRSCG